MQGLLTAPSLNPFQRFAALYAIHMNRREVISDAEDILRKQTWYLNPDRWMSLFAEEEFGGDTLTLAGRPVEEVVDDLDEIDRYFASLDEKRSLSGAQLFDALDEDGWM